MTMRAVRVSVAGGAEELRLEYVDEPVPGPGQALVRVAAAGVNFIEVYQRTGQYSMTHPYTPGTEGAGTVVSVGEGVSSVAPGDRVASVDLTGAYAELALASADRLVRVPDDIALDTAAAAMLQGITAHYLATSTWPLRSGDVCLVHAGAGGVGLLLCQMATRRGTRVIATVSTPEKAELARAAGAADTILYTRTSFVEEVRRMTGGRGVDVVYDSVGLTTFEGSLDSLRPRGMLVLFGQSSGAVPPLDPQVLNRKGSLFLTRPSMMHYIASREELKSRTSDIFRWIGEGVLQVRIDRRVPLADAAEAHRALESRATSGKVLLVP